jgi:hypothetical protein
MARVQIRRSARIGRRLNDLFGLSRGFVRGTELPPQRPYREESPEKAPRA